jgi:hypothetical protein
MPVIPTNQSRPWTNSVPTTKPVAPFPFESCPVNSKSSWDRLPTPGWGIRAGNRFHFLAFAALVFARLARWAAATLARPAFETSGL